MSRVTFNIAAKCDKAGRTQNQDNYWVCPNLDNINDFAFFGNDADVELSPKGALMVVADGMGGMKSGEKASEFVVNGIKSKFKNVPDSILGNDTEMIAFIKDAIIQADADIKAYAKDHRESEGMGSTIVLLWLYGEKAYCGWCGDSRIYCYNPQNSLVRLSHDHSYVQSLVDEGKITEEEAFDHPDGNIITRSLGDSGEKANPETKIYPIHRRDVFLLCSDGLCGLLQDSKLDSILADNCTSSQDALNALWAEGTKEGWTDNATIEVVCVAEGGVTPTRKAQGYDEGKPKPKVAPKPNKADKNDSVRPNFWQNNKQYIIIVGIVAVVAIGIIWFFSGKKQEGRSSNQEFNVERSDEAPQNITIPTENTNQSEPQKQPESTRPDKPANPQPNKPNQPNHSDAEGGNGGNGGNGVTVPIPTPNSDSNQSVNVTQEFLELMKNIYGSRAAVDMYIKNAKERNHFTSAEGIALRDFIVNANNLNSLPDVKGLNPEQKQALQEINATSKRANDALKQYSVYDTPQPPRGGQYGYPYGRGRGYGNGNGNGNNNSGTGTGTTTGDPDYQNI